MNRKDILYQCGNNEVAPVDKEVDDGNNINCETEVTNENYNESSDRFLAAHLLFIEAKYDLLLLFVLIKLKSILTTLT